MSSPIDPTQIEALLEQYDQLAPVVDVIARMRGWTPNQVWAERMSILMNKRFQEWAYENKILIDG